VTTKGAAAGRSPSRRAVASAAPRADAAAPRALPRRGAGVALGAVLASLAAGAACTRGAGTPPAPSSSQTAASSNAPKAEPRAAIDPIAGFDGCLVGHRGILLDLGEKGPGARYGARDDVDAVEREGGTWWRLRERSLAVSFFSSGSDVPAEEAGAPAPTYLEARVRGGAARSVGVYLNGKPAGTWTLSKNESKIVAARAPGPLVQPGDNDVLLRFHGAPKITAEPLAEIDWIHVGAGDVDPAYAAPTRLDVLGDTTLAGVARRTLSLRAPGFVRCTGWLPARGKGEVSIGLAGTGDADVEVRLLRDRAAPAVVAKVHATSNGAWKTESFGVGGGDQGTVGALEIAVTQASKGVRVLLGDPRIDAPPAPPDPRRAPSRSAVLVVLGTTKPGSLGVYGGDVATPEIGALARDGIVFDAHRASSTFPSGALAAIVSGRAAHDVQMDDGDARLPRDVTTISDTARQAGMVTALFTADPMTGAAFGFDRGWETFVAHPPTEDAPATRVFDDAAAWIEAHKEERFLVVIHARGGHPPWDATQDDLKTMAPAEYSGGIDPKHAAELLSKARHVPPTIRFTDGDRARAAALYALAIRAHDAAIGRLMGAIRTAGRDADTLVALTGDVGVNDAAHVPYGDGEPPQEDVLHVPLILRTGDHASAGARAALPTSDVDVARTLMTALGLEPSSYFQGIDLFRAASGFAPPGGRPLLATAGPRFSLRWGSFVLGGTEHRHELCDLALEPACLTDVRATHPIAAEALARRAAGVLHPPGRQDLRREAAPVDAATLGALKAWGR